uniref:Uncharacterized protein n=1 Tax=Anguilla anguilla TaxID=7936 RepID=A0A0E9R891_ANGAN
MYVPPYAELSYFGFALTFQCLDV